ncbi:MAG: acetate--CoA ligase family protein [Haloferacaceae archaeon]
MNQSRPDLDPLFDPDSVAVVGASPDSWYSSRLMDNLLDYGYEGDVYPVNPSRDEAWDRPCYDSITDVPEVVDLAVVSVPREYVVDVVRDAGEMGVPAALVITAGFGEADETGAELEAELAAVAEERDVRVCGPNCIGLANAQSGTVLTSTCSREPEPGHIGLASHSGALAFTTFFERAADEDVHFAHVVSTGNEADQSLTDYVEYMAGDPDVDVVCVYVEGLDDPRRFVDVASAATRSGTPVLAVKIGRSEVAQAAAASHTGSLTGNDAVWESALWQAGVERVPDVPDLIGRASVHAAFDAPDSPRTCIASTSGGLATLLADLADVRGLELPPLSPDTEGALLDMEELLTFGELHNPADIRGYGAEVIPEIADHLFADDRFDSYLFAIGLSAVDDRAAQIADDLVDVVDRADDPVVLLWTGRKDPADLDDPQPYERLREAAPLFYDPANAVDALSSLVEFGEARARVPPADAALSPASAATESGPDLPDGRLLTWAEATDLLAAYDIEPVATRRAANPEEAAAAADTLGYPVVCKVDSPDVGHRNRVGAVKIGLDSPGEVREAYAEVLDNTRDHLPDADVEGVLVQPQVAAGVEALVGLSRDPEFGPVVTVATGGTFVELFDDAAHLLPPVTEAQARAALDRTRLPDLLDAEYGTTAALDVLASLVADVSRLAAERDDVDELDLNPVVLDADGLAAVDVLVRTR